MSKATEENYPNLLFQSVPAQAFKTLEKELQYPVKETAEQHHHRRLQSTVLAF